MKFTRSVNTSETNCEIEIRLNDECKNGHEDFAITATFWAPGKPRTDRHMEVSGCCHDEILQACPEYTRFTNLHLRDFKGAPMHTVENGMYHAFKGQYRSEKAGPEELAKYFNIPLWMAEKLCTAGDKEHFAYLIEELEIPKMWKMQADAAIEQLEKMTGEKFVSKATRSHYTPLTDERRAEIAQRIKSGFYTTEAITTRNDEQKKLLAEKLVAELVQKEVREIENIQTTTAVNIALTNRFPEKNGNWWYWHKDTSIKFNDGYSVKFTDDEITEALEIVKHIVPGIVRKQK